MKCAFWLNIVVSQSSAVFELNAGEDKSLLIGWYALFVLNLKFYFFNRIVRINIKRYCFSCESLHINLHLAYVLRLVVRHVQRDFDKLWLLIDMSDLLMSYQGCFRTENFKFYRVLYAFFLGAKTLNVVFGRRT